MLQIFIYYIYSGSDSEESCKVLFVKTLAVLNLPQ